MPLENMRPVVSPQERQAAWEGYPQSRRGGAPTAGWRNLGPYQWWNLHGAHEEGAA